MESKHIHSFQILPARVIFILTLYVATVNCFFQQACCSHVFNINWNHCLHRGNREVRSIGKVETHLFPLRSEESRLNSFQSRLNLNSGFTSLVLEKRGGSFTNIRDIVTLQSSADSISSEDDDTGMMFLNARASRSTYYLLISKKVWLQIFFVTSMVIATQKFLHHSSFASLRQQIHPYHHHMPGSLSTKSPWILQRIILPLLSSSCCFIQLLLNIFKVGCAGFNTKLGPLRPWFTSLLLAWTISSFSFQKSWFISTFFTWCLAILPEIIHMYNTYVQNILLPSTKRKSSLKPDDLSLQQTIEAKIEIDVPSMGCVACINKINASMLSFSSKDNNQAIMTDASSWLLERSEEAVDKKRGGKVLVKAQASSQEQVEEFAENVISTITNAGFDCSVNSIQYADDTHI